MKTRVTKIEKYMEIIIDGSLVKNKINVTNVPDQYIFALNLSLDANLFYGLDNELQWISISKNHFDEYKVVCRLLSWSKDNNIENYSFRVLKSNPNEIVDLQEEREYLNSYIDTSIYNDIRDFTLDDFK